MVYTSGLKDGVRDTTKQKIADESLFIAVGDGSTTPTQADTTLDNETFRKARDSVDLVTSVDKVTVDLFMDTTENNGNDIEEAAPFDANSGGNMVNRKLLGITLTKTSDINVIISFEDTVTVTETT